MEFLPGSPADSTALAQQRPAHVLEPLGIRFSRHPQAGALRSANLIHGLVQMGGDVEAIQHVDRLFGLGGDDVQIRLPHIAADRSEEHTSELHSLAYLVCRLLLEK